LEVILLFFFFFCKGRDQMLWMSWMKRKMW